MAYNKIGWLNNKSPYINQPNLNKMDNGIYSNSAAIASLSMGETMKGEWKPSAGVEYPLTPTVSDSYYIGELSSPYLFTGGDLSGETTDNQDKILYTSDGWVLLEAQNIPTNIVKYVETAGDLSGVDTNIYLSAIVREDGRGGVFNYDASRIGENDGGTVFDGWVRQYTGSIYVSMFGVEEGDDMSTVLQTMLSMDESIIVDVGGKINSVDVGDSKTITISEELTCTDVYAIKITGFGTEIHFTGKGKLSGDSVSDGQEGIILENAIHTKIMYPFLEGFRNKSLSIIGTSNNNTIFKPRVRGAISDTGAGIALHGSNVVSNTIYHADASQNRIGITINGSHYNTLIHPIASDCNSMGISIDGIISGSGDGGRYNKIDHPICNGNGIVTDIYAGIYIGNGSSFNEIVHPICLLNKGAGIRFSGGVGYENRSNSIIDPVCMDNDKNGVTLSWCPSMTIRNITSVSNTGHGIVGVDCEGIKILGGLIESNTLDGIQHQSPSTIDDGVTVSSNGGDGIRIAFGGDGGLGSNRSVNCHLDSNTLEEYASAGGSKAVNCTGYVTNNCGVANKSNSQTIAHGLGGVPTRVLCTGTVSGEIVSVNTITDTTFSVSIVDHTGVAGTLQDISWEASLY